MIEMGFNIYNFPFAVQASDLELKLFDFNEGPTHALFQVFSAGLEILEHLKQIQNHDTVHLIPGHYV